MTALTSKPEETCGKVADAAATIKFAVLNCEIVGFDAAIETLITAAKEAIELGNAYDILRRKFEMSDRAFAGQCEVSKDLHTQIAALSQRSDAEAVAQTRRAMFELLKEHENLRREHEYVYAQTDAMRECRRCASLLSAPPQPDKEG